MKKLLTMIGAAADLAAKALAAAVAAMLPMAVKADNPSILLNGSFESYTAGTNDAFTNSQLHAGMNSSRHVNDWGYSGGGVCASGDNPFLGGKDAADGVIAVYLQNSNWISQDIMIDTAGTYEISFRYAGRPNYLNGSLHVKIIDADNLETEIGSVACPVTAFRTAYMKVYLAVGGYTLKIEHAKASGTSGDSIVDMVAMRRMDNLVSNPSFEDYRNENNDWSGSYKAFKADTFIPEAWGYSGSLVMQKSGTPFMSVIPDGAIAVAMRKNAVLTQEIVAPTIGVYEVSFKYGKRNNSGSVKYYACLDDEELGSVNLTTTAVKTAYFKANLEAGVSYTLSITNNATADNGNTDSGIDLVSVVASTNLLLNGGFDNGYMGGGNGWLQANQAEYYNPFWTAAGAIGRTGLEGTGSSEWHGSVPVGTFAMYIQTLSGYQGVSVYQDFVVTKPGMYALSFNHVKRHAGTDPVTRIRVYSGKDTSGTVVYEKSVTSSLVGSNGVWGEFSSEIKFAEAGTYTFEFYRDTTAENITAVYDNVCLAWSRKIPRGFIISFF